MPEKNLLILTHRFPVEPGEVFLIDELGVIAGHFKNITILPNDAGEKTRSLYELPTNIRIGNYKSAAGSSNDFLIALKIFPILLKEIFNIGTKGNYFRLFKFNLSLLKQSYLKALSVIASIEDSRNTIVYSYWCDDLAITGAFCKMLRPELQFVSRAHGFDVFEEQSDFGHIFFRKFQLTELNRLYTVSKAGQLHLVKTHPEFAGKISQQYLGVRSNGKICYETTDIIRIVTCSHIRSIKRLDLLVETLMLSDSKPIEWHVIGSGEDLESLRKASKKLPSNCRLTFYGHLSTDQIHQLYSSVHFDFLVSLSSSEGLPVSMMEAISHGIPLLATDVGGCREIVNETTGILIEAQFSRPELMKMIGNCKGKKFDSLDQRQAIVQFWEREFNAEMNYTRFAEEIISL